MTLTLAQKQFLQAKEVAGKRTATVAYDPTKVTGAPYEAAAIAAGYTQYHKETSANLVEVVYYKT